MKLPLQRSPRRATGSGRTKEGPSDGSEASFGGRARQKLPQAEVELGKGKSIMRGATRRRAFGEAFEAIAAKRARLEALKHVQQKAERELWASQRAEELRTTPRVRPEWKASLTRRREAFRNERLSTILVQDMEDAAHRHEWRNRSQARKAAYERHLGAAEEDRKLGVDQLLEQIKNAQ